MTAKGRGQPIDRSAWPGSGPFREWLEYCDRLHRENGLPSLRAIAACMVGLSSPTRVGVLVRGLSLPVDDNQARALLEALGGVGNEVDRGLRLYRKARTSLTEQSSIGTPGRIGSRTRALGRIVGELGEADALMLEVHPSIVIDEAATPVLPPYLHRTHDDRLREALAQAEARSLAVMLVGGSSTGKTRACWEAIREVLPDWRVWHPLAPERPEAIVEALNAGRIAPRTVIWLNEAQMYLQPSGTGERVATALQDLIYRGKPGPVVVLGSMWPEHWMALSSRESGHEHAARTLLQLCRAITVPPDFEPEELNRLARTIHSDPRLRLAAAHGGRRITQHLAGAPELVRRYEHASEPARAVVWAAMDARRLSRWLYLPPQFLYQAAPGYLDPQVWDQTGDGDSWFTQAMAYLTKPCHGAPGPLVQRKPRPGVYDPAVRYRLADFLEQTGRVDRAALFPPASFWQAMAVIVTDPGILRGLARQAEDRGRYRRAAQFYQLAAGRGDRDALHRGIFLRYRVGDGAGAQHLAMQALNHGDTSGVVSLAGWRQSAGGWASAEALYRLAADHGDTKAMVALAESWRRIRPPDYASAEALALQAADGGSTRGLRTLAEWREQQGDLAGAEALAGQAADRGDTSVLVAIADKRKAAGLQALALRAAERGDTRTFVALARLYLAAAQPSGRNSHVAKHALSAAERGDTTALMSLLQRRASAGDLAGAERLYRQAADRGDNGALRAVAQLRLLAGDRDGAEQAYRSAVDRGDRSALVGLAGQRLRAGDPEGAEVLYERAADLDVPFAMTSLTTLRERDNPVRAEELALQAADRGNTMPLIALAIHWELAGDVAGAEALYRRVIDRGDPRPATSLIRLREQAGDHDGAESVALQAARRGSSRPLAELAEMREQAGDHTGAEALAVRAADHGETATLRTLAWKREHDGDQARARFLLRQAADRGDTSAILRLAKHHQDTGDHSGAEKLLLEAVNRGAASGALRELARQRKHAGDHTGAEQIKRYGLSDDGKPATVLA